MSPYALGRTKRILRALAAGAATTDEIAIDLHAMGDLRATPHHVSAILWHLRQAGRVRRTDRVMPRTDRGGRTYRFRVWEGV